MRAMNSTYKARRRGRETREQTRDRVAGRFRSSPLKVLIWDDDGQTKASFTSPAVLAARHHLPDELASRLAGIGSLVDALID